MQNANLFDKIRQTSLNDVSGTDDFDPEKLWADLQRKQHRNRIWPWRISAAASVLILIGLGISIFLREQNDPPSAATNAIVKAQYDKNPKVKSIEKAVGRLQAEQGPLPKPRSHLSPKGTVRAEKPRLELVGTANQVHLYAAGFIADTIVASGLISNISGPTQLNKAAGDTLQSRNLSSSEAAVEKVLIADISFPEKKAEAPSALARMFEQVRNDRLSRKNRLQFNRTYSKPGLWSFVHHSFKEYPSETN